LQVPVDDSGPWIGTSPFGEPIYQEAGNVLHLQVSGNVDTYLSSEGMLRCTQGAWMWIPFSE
jgi:hypothetical protein